jgi:hypothetical protein
MFRASASWLQWATSNLRSQTQLMTAFGNHILQIELIASI